MLELTQESLTELVKNTKGVLVIDVYCSWCRPCVAFAPQFDRIAEGHPTHTFAKICADDCLDFVGTFGVQSVPSFLFFKDGQFVGKTSGGNRVIIEDKIKEIQ